MCGPSGWSWPTRADGSELAGGDHPGRGPNGGPAGQEPPGRHRHVRLPDRGRPGVGHQLAADPVLAPLVRDRQLVAALLAVADGVFKVLFRPALETLDERHGTWPGRAGPSGVAGVLEMCA